MRHICDTCGTLSNDETIGDKHAGCYFDGSWQPFPDLSPRLAVDLVCQQLMKAPEDEAFAGSVQIWECLDMCVWGSDAFIAKLRDICTYRLETGRWVRAHI